MGWKQKVAETVTIATQATDAEILAAADAAAGAGKVWGTSKFRRTAVRADGSLEYDVVSAVGIHQMSVDVLVQQGEGSHRTVTTRISHYTTSQEKFLMLIPVSPKAVVGIKAYRRFMVALQGQLGPTRSQVPGPAGTTAVPAPAAAPPTLASAPEGSALPGSSFCGACGASVRQSAPFCGSCGSAVRAAT